jgi:hypothetical protein
MTTAGIFTHLKTLAGRMRKRADGAGGTKKLARAEQAKRAAIEMRVRQAERLRVEAILHLPEANANPELAGKLAYEGDVTVEDARKVFKKFGRTDAEAAACAARKHAIALIEARMR